MYSPLITDRRLYSAKKSGLQFKRLPRADSIEISSKLERLRLDREGRPLPEGQLSRALFRGEEEFIESERLICRCDFEYYFTRYHRLEIDPGVTDQSVDDTNDLDKKIAAPALLESQRRYITLFGRREEVCTEEQRKYKFTSGILAYIHKVRQVSATATMCGMGLHRMIFWPGTRAFAATLKDGATGTGELFKRYHIAYDNLPWWLKPKLDADVKDTELRFQHPISSRLTLQAENTQQGIGTGTQQDFSHLTEVALWQYTGRIRFSFVPSIPKAITTLHVQESTAAGKGNYWYEVTEQARHRRAGYEDWVYCFIPWYMNKLKYRGIAPDSWIPSEHTIQHAELIERTSPEWFDGKTIRPNRSQLYWWEKTRDQHAANGELASFLTNYAATPEQSFQADSQGALPIELLEKMEAETRQQNSYEVEVAAA